MNLTTIITMASVGVAATVGEKVLNSFGKADMASFCNIAGLAGLGISAIGTIVELLNKVKSLG